MRCCSYEMLLNHHAHLCLYLPVNLSLISWSYVQEDNGLTVDSDQQLVMTSLTSAR